MNTARLILDGQEYELPIVVGSEGEQGIDITQLRAKTNFVTVDSGFGNTGSCTSAICFINGEKGVLRYRGYPIEQLAENAAFSEVCYLLIYGELPNKQQAAEFRDSLTHHSMIHEDMKKFFEGYPPTAHPMAIPTNMFTVMFALGRLPGWIAHWKEMRDDPAMRINRPRQIYVGEREREFVPIERR